MRISSALSQQYAAAAFAAPLRGLPRTTTLVRASNKCPPLGRMPTSSTPATPKPLEGEHAPVASDGPFGRAAIAVFRRVMAPHVGWTSPRPGYGGMVDECRMLLAKKTPDQQRQIVLAVLGTLFVAPRGPALFRKYFADKPAANARITPGFFSWLVGPSTTNDSPEAGGTLGTGVLIEKCRFLDESGCKGLCLNMCQQVCFHSFFQIWARDGMQGATIANSNRFVGCSLRTTWFALSSIAPQLLYRPSCPENSRPNLTLVYFRWPCAHQFPLLSLIPPSRQPTQEFFTDSLGLPLRMTPNFETKSCQMSFGVPPLPIQDDPAHQSGCLAACKMSGSFKGNNSNSSPSSGTACYIGKPALEAPDDVRITLPARTQ
jgi:hypothetical protein